MNVTEMCRMAILAAVFAGMLFPAVALELTAWKGETVNAFLPDGENVAAVRKGFEVKVGALKPVGYSQAPVIWRKVMSNAFDRVVWGDFAPTQRVVQVKVPRNAKAGINKFGDLSVKVVNRTITPVAKRDFYLDIWQHPWASARTSKTKPFSKEKSKEGESVLLLPGLFSAPSPDRQCNFPARSYC